MATDHNARPSTLPDLRQDRLRGKHRHSRHRLHNRRSCNVCRSLWRRNACSRAGLPAPDGDRADHPEHHWQQRWRWTYGSGRCGPSAFDGDRVPLVPQRHAGGRLRKRNTGRALLA